MAGQQDHAPALNRAFFAQDPLVVAPALLGAVLEHEVGGVRVAVRLTEVEAYLGEGEDPASHAHRGQRPRSAVMFGPPGHAYVYFTYGMHWCANVVCRPAGVAGAVLFRAGEVIAGAALARDRRPAARRDVDLARGPARLAAALGLTGADNARDLLSDPTLRIRLRDGPDSQFDAGLRIRPGAPVPSERIRRGPRVGVAAAADRPCRYWLDGEPSVSPYRPAKPRPRRPRSNLP